MQMSSYSQTLRDQLLAAAAPGGESVQAIAEQLTTALDPAFRLVLLEALSTAAAEVTAALDQAVVEMRLRGGEPEFVVAEEPVAAAEPVLDVDENTARITLRLPETVKARVEQTAAAEGTSVNAWLVRAITRALDPATQRRTSSGRRISGYVRG